MIITSLHCRRFLLQNRFRHRRQHQNLWRLRRSVPLLPIVNLPFLLLTLALVLTLLLPLTINDPRFTPFSFSFYFTNGSRPMRFYCYRFWSEFTHTINKFLQLILILITHNHLLHSSDFFIREICDVGNSMSNWVIEFISLVVIYEPGGFVRSLIGIWAILFVFFSPFNCLLVGLFAGVWFVNVIWRLQNSGLLCIWACINKKWKYRVLGCYSSKSQGNSRGGWFNPTIWTTSPV